jgi:Zinc finger, C2H2 type
VIPSDDESDGVTDGDDVMLKEVLEEAVKIEDEKKVGNSEFVAIDIKEEPMEADEDNNKDTWRYEYLDEVIVKVEEIIDESSVTNPVVVLTRLEAHEIQKWTRVKEEKFESTALKSMLGFDETLPEVKKVRKKYNDGKPRKEGQPRKLVYKRVKRILKPGECYTCDMCGNNYTSWVSLHSHVTTVHKPIGDLPCEFCKKLFKASGNLRRHILSIHKKSRPHICHICAKAFSTNSKLTQHLKTHNEPEECEICGKFVRSIEDHLRRHKKSYARTFIPCNVCGKLYDKNIIQMHIDRVHGKSFNGNIFRCDDCNINYTRREDWRQ